MAHAVPTTATISNQQFDTAEASTGTSVRLSFNWSVPDDAQSGDTFTVVLPDEIRAKSTAGFTLQTPSGATAANAVWSGKTVTFTLTDYVNTNDNIRGTAFFNVEWDRSTVDTSVDREYTLDFTGSTSWSLPLKLIADGPAGEGQSLSKVGWWLSDDQGASSSIKQLGWVVYLDTGTSKKVEAPVTIADTPGFGSKIDLNSVEGFVNGQPLSKDRYFVERNGANGVTIKLYGNYPGESAVYDGENIYFTYSSDLLPGENGIFTNSVLLTEGSSAGTTITAEVRRDGAGGDGEGDPRRLTPVAPHVVQALCVPESGEISEPTLALAQTDNISYSIEGTVAMGETVTVKATAAKDFYLGTSTGWVLSEDKLTATMNLTFDTIECEKPLTPVDPETPAEPSEPVAPVGPEVKEPDTPLASTGFSFAVLGLAGLAIALLGISLTRASKQREKAVR